MTHARDERTALATLLTETGPDAPTLCAGWRTGDLVAHLVLRERRPDAAAGVLGGPLAGHTARVQRRYLDRYTYAELVSLLRAGPPKLSPFALPGMDEAANTMEFFVHHEDIRRAVDGWTQRKLPPGLSDALWKRLRGARMFLRAAPTGVTLTRTDGDSSAGVRDVTAGAAPIIAKNATPSVTVSGTPAELTLWSMGRTSAAHVTFDGPSEAVERLMAWRA